MITRLGCVMCLLAGLGLAGEPQARDGRAPKTPPTLTSLGRAGAPREPARLRLTGEIVDDATARPLPARIYIQGADGAWHFPRSQAADGAAIPYKKQRGDNPRCVEMHTTLSAHPFTVELPPGKYTVTVERGHEYLPATQTVTLADKSARVTIKLRRWIDMAGLGWYSGDTHVHRPLDELPNLVLAEDLNVAFPLVYWVTEAFAPPKSSSRSPKQDPEAKPIAVDAAHLIYPRNTEYEIFTVNKKAHTLGALFVLRHRGVLDKGVPPLAGIVKQARAEGALLDLDKPNWPWSMILVALLNVDLYELANNHMWRTEFGFPAFGEPPPAYMKIERDAKGFTERGWIDFNFQNYYALLNCGFKMRPTAGTASGVHPVPLGFGRVYVHQSKGLNFDGWFKGLDEGRSFVTTGPMLLAQLNGKLPGTPLAGAEATNRLQVTGTVHSAQPLDRIEIVVNGVVAKTLQPANRKTERGGHESPIDAEVAASGSSWLAVRCWEPRPGGRWRYAHTAPWHVRVEGMPLRPRRAETDFLIGRVTSQIERSRPVLPAAALAEYEQALRVYQKIAETAVD
ncbi:MAG: CehA/McbA family metallohydrolase [Gemmataceae bacterium]|nr:CehA/McbA family metallohydrolase [Gemmataceae bacterium]